MPKTRIDAVGTGKAKIEFEEPAVTFTIDFKDPLHIFAEVVMEMRKAQKAYFDSRTRSQETLLHAKRLEAAVDLRLGALGFKP